MAAKSKRSSDREKWQKIFNGLVHMLNTQQSQLDVLLKQRKLLEDRIKLQYERWVSDVQLFKDQMSKLNDELAVQEMLRSMDSAKLDLVVAMKQKQASLYKLKLGHAESELVDFREGFVCLSQNHSDPDGISPKDNQQTYERGKGSQDCYAKAFQSKKEVDIKAMEAEIKRLKHDYEKLASGKSSEISALLAQKDFVWNQYNIMENNFTDKLKSKGEEVEKANEKIEKLLARVEQLQYSNKDKDETIARLQTKIQDDANKSKEEIARLSQELGSLKKSHPSSVTPVLRHCKERASSSRGAQISGSVKESKKGGRGLKRRGDDAVPIPEMPKLFSSSFKVPKLKSSSSHID